MGLLGQPLLYFASEGTAVPCLSDWPNQWVNRELGGSEHSRCAQAWQGVAPSGLSGHVATRQTPPLWGARRDASACPIAVLASSAGCYYGFRSPDSGFCEVAASTFGLLACAGCPLRRFRPLFWNGRCFTLKPWRCVCAGTPSPRAGLRPGGWASPGGSLCASPPLSNTMWRQGSTSSSGFSLLHPKRHQAHGG